jgi:hypothetical protein
MAYTSVTYADISSGTEVRRTEPKCPHISKLSKERLVGARKAPTGIFSRRCQKGSDRNLNEEAHNGATVRRRSASRWACGAQSCAPNPTKRRVYTQAAPYGGHERSASRWACGAQSCAPNPTKRRVYTQAAPYGGHERSASRWARRTIVCAESHQAESLDSSGAIRRPRE